MNIYSWGDAEGAYYVLSSVVQVINSIGKYGVLLAFILLVLFVALQGLLNGVEKGNAFINPVKILSVFVAYAVLYTLTVTVTINDKCNPGTSYSLSDVPLGVALPAYVTSLFGFTLSEYFENSIYTSDNFKRTKQCSRMPQDIFSVVVNDINVPSSDDGKVIEYGVSSYIANCVIKKLDGNISLQKTLFDSTDFISTMVNNSAFATNGPFTFDFCNDSTCSNLSAKTCSEAATIVSDMINDAKTPIANYLKNKYKLSAVSDVYTLVGDLDNAYIQSSLANDRLMLEIAIIKLFDRQYRSYVQSFGVDPTTIGIGMASSAIESLKTSIQNNMLYRISGLVKGDAFWQLSVILFPFIILFAIASAKLELYISWIQALLWTSMFPLMTSVVDYFVYKAGLPLQSYFDGSFTYSKVVDAFQFYSNSSEFIFWNSMYSSIPLLAYFAIKGITGVLGGRIIAGYGGLGDIAGSGGHSSGGGSNRNRPTDLSYEYKNDAGGITRVNQYANAQFEGIDYLPTGGGTTAIGGVAPNVRSITRSGYDSALNKFVESTYDGNNNLISTDAKMPTSMQQTGDWMVTANQGTTWARKLNDAFNKVIQSQDQILNTVTSSDSFSKAVKQFKQDAEKYFSGADTSVINNMSVEQQQAMRMVDNYARGKNMSTEQKSELASALSMGLSVSTPKIFGFQMGAGYDTKIAGATGVKDQEVLKAMKQVMKSNDFKKAVQDSANRRKNAGNEVSNTNGYAKELSKLSSFVTSDSNVKQFNDLNAKAENVSFENGRFVSTGDSSNLDMNSIISNLSNDLMADIFQDKSLVNALKSAPGLGNKQRAMIDKLSATASNGFGDVERLAASSLLFQGLNNSRLNGEKGIFNILNATMGTVKDTDGEFDKQFKLAVGSLSTDGSEVKADVNNRVGDNDRVTVEPKRMADNSNKNIDLAGEVAIGVTGKKPEAERVDYYKNFNTNNNVDIDSKFESEANKLKDDYKNTKESITMLDADKSPIGNIAKAGIAGWNKGLDMANNAFKKFDSHVKPTNEFYLKMKKFEEDTLSEKPMGIVVDKLTKDK